MIKKIKEHGYEGKLWPVNPTSSEIVGFKAYLSIDQLPAVPDLAIVAIPSKFVLTALRDLAAMGTGAVIVLTAGFGEKDEAGKQSEQEMLRIAARAKHGPYRSQLLRVSHKDI